MLMSHRESASIEQFKQRSNMRQKFKLKKIIYGMISIRFCVILTSAMAMEFASDPADIEMQVLAKTPTIQIEVASDSDSDTSCDTIPNTPAQTNDLTHEYLQTPPSYLFNEHARISDSTPIPSSWDVLKQLEALTEMVIHFQTSNISSEARKKYNEIYPDLVQQCIEEGLKIRFSPHFRWNNGIASLNELANLTNTIISTEDRSFSHDCFRSFMRDLYCKYGIRGVLIAGFIAAEVPFALKADYYNHAYYNVTQNCSLCLTQYLDLLNGTIMNTSLLSAFVSAIENCTSYGDNITQPIMDFLQNLTAEQSQWSCTLLDTHTYLLAKSWADNSSQNVSNTMQLMAISCKDTIVNATTQCLDVVNNITNNIPPLEQTLYGTNETQNAYVYHGELFTQLAIWWFLLYGCGINLFGVFMLPFEI